MLDPEGNVDLRGIQEERPAGGWNSLKLVRKLLTGKTPGRTEPTPRQEIVFVCSGREDHYKTSFSVFGFRYVQVFGDITLKPEDFESIAVYSDLEQTGMFSCSNELVNRQVLQSSWPMIEKYADYLLSHLGMRDKKAGKENPANAFTYEKGVHLAWLKIMAGEVSQFMSVLTADRFEGPYTFVRKIYKPLDMDTGDFCLHVDEKRGKAYIWFERPHFQLICGSGGEKNGRLGEEPIFSLQAIPSDCSHGIQKRIGKSLTRRNIRSFRQSGPENKCLPGAVHRPCAF